MPTIWKPSATWRWHFWLGIPAVILSTVVGTAVFATLENQSVGITARVIIALVSIAAAVLAGLQTFLRMSETAAAHGQAGDWYASIKRDIEQAARAAPRGARQRQDLHRHAAQGNEQGGAEVARAARKPVDDHRPSATASTAPSPERRRPDGSILKIVPGTE